MERRNAREAVMERIGMSMSSVESEELYALLCNFLVTKDTVAYVELIRTKYGLLIEGVSLQECSYLTMEILLEIIDTDYTLVLDAMAYVVKYKS